MVQVCRDAANGGAETCYMLVVRCAVRLPGQAVVTASRNAAVENMLENP